MDIRPVSYTHLNHWAITRLLSEISGKQGTDYGLMAAAVSLIVVPLIVVYVCLQKYIIKGMTAGAVSYTHLSAEGGSVYGPGNEGDF